jgi:hypothetical protein
MGRLKGSKNKTSDTKPYTSTLMLSPKERVQFLANLIIDRIIEDQNNGRPLLKTIKQDELTKEEHATPT